ncbi:MAG TPA: aa3-type cytochrome c oxidase subunit IV [Trinickia sp.]|uniref:aa3-type cytochrome c oxidase subunit IV n=1 Tax=Trinickia sp. TaxID=2571163 RepID=UPI002F402928
MATHGTVEYATASGNDYEAHEGTYKTFLKLLKWHLIVIVLILCLMAYFRV